MKPCLAKSLRTGPLCRYDRRVRGTIPQLDYLPSARRLGGRGSSLEGVSDFFGFSRAGVIKTEENRPAPHASDAHGVRFAPCPVVALTSRVTVDVPAPSGTPRRCLDRHPPPAAAERIQPLLETKWKGSHFALSCQFVIGILSRTGLPLLSQHEGRHRDPNRIDKHVSHGWLGRSASAIPMG